MKRWIVGVLALASLAAAPSPHYVVDKHGHKHYKGYLGQRPGTNYGAVRTWTATPEIVAALPDHYDSRKQGFVSPIRDQGQCGSCFAHALVKAFESSRVAKGAPFLKLSEQDEMMNGAGEGCDGGYMSGDHITHHGEASEKDCPYIARDKACTAPPADRGLDWSFIGANAVPTVDDLRAAIVAHDVIVVTVAAGGIDWVGGNSGRMTDCSNTGIDHMVNLVGYDKNADGSFTFIGANSWGTDWGDKGFFYAKAGPGGCDQLADGPYSALFIDAMPHKVQDWHRNAKKS